MERAQQGGTIGRRGYAGRPAGLRPGGHATFSVQWKLSRYEIDSCDARPSQILPGWSRRARGKLGRILGLVGAEQCLDSGDETAHRALCCPLVPWPWCYRLCGTVRLSSCGGDTGHARHGKGLTLPSSPPFRAGDTKCERLNHLNLISRGACDENGQNPISSDL